MSYISVAFAVFVVCLLAVYAVTPNKYKWVTLLVFSLIFYGSSGLDKLAFVLCTSLVVYASSRRMESVWAEFEELRKAEGLTSQEKKDLKKAYTAKSRRVLLLALFVSVGVLCWCKLSLKALALYNTFTGSSLAMKIIVPLGVSYYTFSSIGYLVDIHWRAVKVEKSYPKLLLCMIYFPHVVEGPIPRYERLLPQLDKLTFPDYDRFCMGLQLVLWGLFKKMVVADRLGIFVNGVFNNVNNGWGFLFAVALVFAAFQMYADFSGCMDIITGISDIVGIKLDKNFERPFLSRTVSEFWRRWHISLFNWLKDYIYMPLLTSSVMGGIRKRLKDKCSPKTIRSIMSILPTACVFLIIGIWHDVSVQYVLHGLYWTVLFVLSSFLEDKLAEWNTRLRVDTESGAWHLFQTLRTFALYAFSYITFAPHSLRDMLTSISHMFKSFNPWILWDGTLYNYGLNSANFKLGVLGILFLIAVDIAQEKCCVREVLAKRNIAVRWCVYLAGILAVMVFGIYGPGYDAVAFIYENF